MAIGTIAGIGLGLAGVGSIIGGSSSNKAAGKAADVSLAVAEKNNALAREMYGKNEGYLAPYAKSGLQPNSLLAGAAGYGDTGAYQSAFRKFIDGSDYAFQNAQGTNKVNSGFAGSGTLQSGAALKGLEDYEQNLQAGYRGEFNSLLGNQQALGLSAGSSLAGVGQNYVNTISANNNSAGTAAANAIIAKGNNNPLAGAMGLLGGGLFGMR